MNQLERLDYLLDAFIKDSDGYQDLKVDNDLESKKVALRSLMNIRMPKSISSDVLKVQDEYLKQRNIDRGIVSLDDIKTIKESGSNNEFGDKISIWKGDITRLKLDAIVNAANSQMLGCFVPMHTCIDNCIHTFAGIELRQECDRQMKAKRIEYGNNYEQPTSIPMLTDGYNLPCKKVIHVVGPIIYTSVSKDDENKLADTYLNVLNMCKENNLRSVAFCCISTGVFNFPKKLASHIAVESVNNWLKDNNEYIDRVVFNVFNDEDMRYYKDELF